MQMVANWSIHETDWENYTKLNLTRARNTGGSSQAVLFPFLKGLRAEIGCPYAFGKEKGYISVTLYLLQGRILPVAVPHWGRDRGWLSVPSGLHILAIREGAMRMN